MISMECGTFIAENVGKNDEEKTFLILHELGEELVYSFATKCYLILKHKTYRLIIWRKGFNKLMY